MLKPLLAIFICTSIGIFILMNPVGARVYLDINAPSFVQIPIVLAKWKSIGKTPPTLSMKVYEILSNDLLLSGFFKVIDYSKLPPHLKEREGIPDPLLLSEWVHSGGEILMVGDVALEPNTLQVILRYHLVDLIEQKRLIGKQIEGHLQNLRYLVHRISDEVIFQLTGEHGMNNTKLAYVMRQGESKEIFIADFDGANIKQLTKNQSINLSPAWSPDGKKIIFTSYLKRNPDLYMIELHREGLHRLSFQSGLNAAPSWSPDGKKLAIMLSREGKSEIAIIDSNGTNPKYLTRGHGNESSPSWSPDGQWIAFCSDRSGSPQIYLMDTEGSNLRRLTYEGNYNTSPSWSPKGDRIAFCGRIGGEFHIFTIGVDGSGLRKLTSNSGNNESPCWSPDGRYIAFSSTRTGSSKIYIMNSNGSNQRPLTSSKGGESSPTWSPRF